MDINKVSKEVIISTTQWIKDKPTGAKFDSLSVTFSPLLDELTTICEWAVTGVRTGNSRYFIPKIKGVDNYDTEYSDSINFKIKVSRIIQNLSNRGHILSTIDFCTQLYLQNKSLSIWANSVNQDLNSTHLHICVSNFLGGLKDQLVDIKQVVDEFDPTMSNNNSKLKLLKTKIESSLIMCPNVDFLGNEFTILQHNDFSTLQFKLYLSLVTLLEPSWDRIVMLPTITPSGHLHHPGGLVLCETAQNAFLDFDTLEDLRRISSIPFLPWMLTARTTERGDDQHLAPKLEDFRKGISNDYRNIEYLMGGKKYTLTNKSLFKLHFNEDLNIEKRKSLSKLTKYVGVKEVWEFLKSEGHIKDDEISLTTSSMKISSTEMSSEVNENYEVWTKEMSQKRANIEGSQISGYTNTISIIVPIASSNERIENFLIALNSYDSQTAIKNFPELFELIILIDSNAENSEFRESKIKTILDHITQLENLRQIDIKAFYSRRSESIGRSSIRNFGISKSKGTIIQLFDDSIVLHQNYLEEIFIRFEHLRGQKVALVGFKERVDKDKNTLNKLLNLMNQDLFIPDARDDFKRKEKSDETVHCSFNKISPGDNIDYMRLSGDLCFMNGSREIGSRTLNQFFSTSNVSFWKEECVASGGFHYRFDKDWGMEDGHLGMLLTATGTKIVPCYSALALDLRHTKDKTKIDSKENGERPLNMDVEVDLNGRKMSYYNKELFKTSVAKVSRYFSDPYTITSEEDE